MALIWRFRGEGDGCVVDGANGALTCNPCLSYCTVVSRDSLTKVRGWRRMW